MKDYDNGPRYFAIGTTALPMDVPRIRKERGAKCEGLGPNKIKVWLQSPQTDPPGPPLWSPEAAARILTQSLKNLAGDYDLIHIQHGFENVNNIPDIICDKCKRPADFDNGGGNCPECGEDLCSNCSGGWVQMGDDCLCKQCSDETRYWDWWVTGYFSPI